MPADRLCAFFRSQIRQLGISTTGCQSIVPNQEGGKCLSQSPCCCIVQLLCLSVRGVGLGTGISILKNHCSDHLKQLGRQKLAASSECESALRVSVHDATWSAG